MCPWAVKHLTTDVWACARLWMHVQLCKAVGPELSRDTASLLADVTMPAPLRVGCRGRRVGVAGTETNLGHDRSTGGGGDARLRRLRGLGWSLAEGLGGHNYRGLLRSHHSHGWCQGALLEEQRRDEEINRMWRLAYSKATENRRQAPQCSCHIWCPDLSGHRLTDKEEGGDVAISGRLRRIWKSSMLLFRVTEDSFLLTSVSNRL